MDEKLSQSEDSTAEFDLFSQGNKPDIEVVPLTRERVAHRIADSVVRVFRWAVLGMLAMNSVLLLVLAFLFKDKPEQMETVISKGIVPLMTATGTFASTVFGPLLAFVLGYYFRQEDGERPSRHRAKR